MAAQSNPALSRIESGVLRAFPESIRGVATWDRDWDGIRALAIRTEAQGLPEGHLLNHVVALNLGPEARLETNFGDGWRLEIFPHHGLGVFPALVPYAARAERPGDVLFVEIAPRIVDAATGANDASEPLRPLIGVEDAVAQHVLLALDAEARAGARSSAARATQLVEILISCLVGRQLPPCDSSAREPRRSSGQPAPLPSPKLRRVLDYVATHLDGPLTLPRLAGLVDMDVFRFTRSFKQATGLSPHRYVLEARIGRAKELLSDRALSITEIALQTGFATPSHFSVTFRRIASVTPREYRDGLR